MSGKRKELIVLFILYFLGALSISAIYFFNVDDNILYYSILFLFFVLINKQALKAYEPKGKNIKLIVFSLVPFFAYLLFVVIYRENYFIRYKSLIAIPMIFSIYLMFKYIKIGAK